MRLRTANRTSDEQLANDRLDWNRSKDERGPTPNGVKLAARAIDEFIVLREESVCVHGRVTAQASQGDFQQQVAPSPKRQRFSISSCLEVAHCTCPDA